MTATPETKMKTKAERKQAAWAEYQKIRDAWDAYQKIDDALDAYQKIHAAAWAAFEKKVKEIDDE